MNDPRIGISLGDDTEKLLKGVLDEVGDTVLNELEIERQLEHSEGLAGEPITIGVVLTGSAFVLSAVLRVIERKLEHDHQLKMMKIVAEGFKKHPKLGNTLAAVAKKNAEVAISYGIAEESWAPQLK